MKKPWASLFQKNRIRTEVENKKHSDTLKEKYKNGWQGGFKKGNTLFAGKKVSEEHKEKLRKLWTGHKLTDLQKQKIRMKRMHQVFPQKDTSIEIKLQKELERRNIKFEKHKPILGQPDIFIEPNICIFADGDYWHNREEVKNRDMYVNKNLILQKYIVIRFKEHEINDSVEGCINKIILKI